MNSYLKIQTPTVDTDSSMGELFQRLERAVRGELFLRLESALRDTHATVRDTASRIADEAFRRGVDEGTRQGGRQDDVLIAQYERVFAALAALVGEARARRIAPTGTSRPRLP